MNKVFGIDLGTTYSCIAYIDEYGRASVLKNSDGEHTTPSVVLVESEDNIVVGNEAKRSVHTDSDRTVQFIKRKMGKEKDTVVLNGTTYHAPEISSMILKKIVNDANDELRQTGVLADGEEIKDVVITCPAYFGQNEREATKIAGQFAGLNVIDIINEPTAAAISYGMSGSDKEKKETVLVYDLGGGTFDITVMEINGGDIGVVCTGGDDVLGGKDWDDALMNYVIERYEEEYDEDLSEDPDVVASLYIDVETWKKSLTSREKVNINVNAPAGRLREELTREKYNELTRNLLNRTKNLLDDLLRVAEEKGSRIDKILLVGGSSRMPQVAEMLERDYHIKPSLADPDEAVAKGAALYASNRKAYNDFVLEEAQKANKTVEQFEREKGSASLSAAFAMSAGAAEAGSVMMTVQNVLSRTYGVGVYDSKDDRSKIANMLMINDKLPASASDKFSTLYDGQKSVRLAVYESRSKEKDNLMEIDGMEPITEADLVISKPVPKGTAIFVTLELDNSGLLHIVAEDGMYHDKLDTTFRLSNQMSDADMQMASMRMARASIE